MSGCSYSAGRSIYGRGLALKMFFFSKWFVKRSDSMLAGKELNTAEQTGRDYTRGGARFGEK